MTTPSQALDQLVVSYLEAVARTLVGLPPDRRSELINDLSDHIAAERAAFDSPTEDDIRAILDRLGDPAAVGAEARLQEGPPVWPPARVAPMPALPVGVPARRGPGTTVWVVIAVALALLAVLIVGVCVGLVGLRSTGVGTDGTPQQVAPSPQQT